MEHRRQRSARHRTRSVKQNAAAKKDSAAVSSPLPNIAALIDYGEITIGVLRPVGCIATACDEDQTYYCWKAKYGGMESGDAKS